MNMYKLPIGALLLSYVSFTIGLYLGITESPKWFGSFGALIVLFSVVSEYSLLQFELSSLYRALKGKGKAVFGGAGIPDISPSRTHKAIAFISHLTIIIGTAIWGFGEWYLSK